MENNNVDNELMVNGSMRSVLLKYAVPSIVTLVFFGIQNIIDGIIVGNYVGSDALGGVNIILPFYSFLMVIAMIIGIGSQTLVSMAIGEQNTQRAKDAMSTGFYSLIVVGVALSIFLHFFGGGFASLLGAEERLLIHAKGYLAGLAPFLVPLILAFYSDSILKAIGYPQFSMIVISLTILLNIGLSYYFVAVLGMGTRGASTATGLSFALAFLVISFITMNPRREMVMYKGRFRFSLLSRAFYNGSSEGVSELASAITIMLINLTVVDIAGADGVSAFTAINYVNFAGILLFLGLSDGLIPVLSYNFGAKNYRRVREIFEYVARLVFFMGIGVFVLLQLFGGSVVMLFFKGDNQEVIRFAQDGLRIYAFVFLLIGLNILTTSLFTSLGDAKKSIIIALSRSIIFIIPGLFILSKVMGIDGVWTTMPIAEVLTVFVSYYLYRGLIKKWSDL